MHAIQASFYLIDTEAESVETYRNVLIEFQKNEELYDSIWLSHGT